MPRTRYALAGAEEVSEFMLEMYLDQLLAELRDLAKKLGRKRRARSASNWVDHLEELQQLQLMMHMLPLALDLAHQGRQDRR